MYGTFCNKRIYLPFARLLCYLIIGHKLRWQHCGDGISRTDTPGHKESTHICVKQGERSARVEFACDSVHSGHSFAIARRPQSVCVSAVFNFVLLAVWDAPNSSPPHPDIARTVSRPIVLRANRWLWCVPGHHCNSCAWCCAIRECDESDAKRFRFADIIGEIFRFRSLTVCVCVLACAECMKKHWYVCVHLRIDESEECVSVCTRWRERERTIERAKSTSKFKYISCELLLVASWRRRWQIELTHTHKLLCQTGIRTTRQRGSQFFRIRHTHAHPITHTVVVIWIVVVQRTKPTTLYTHTYTLTRQHKHCCAFLVYIFYSIHHHVPRTHRSSSRIHKTYTHTAYSVAPTRIFTHKRKTTLPSAVAMTS